MSRVQCLPFLLAVALAAGGCLSEGPTMGPATDAPTSAIPDEQTGAKRESGLREPGAGTKPQTQWSLVDSSAQGNKTVAVSFSLTMAQTCTFRVEFTSYHRHAVPAVVTLWKDDELQWLAFSARYPEAHGHNPVADTRGLIGSIRPAEDHVLGSHENEAGLMPGSYSMALSVLGITKFEIPGMPPLSPFLMDVQCPLGMVIHHVSGGKTATFAAWDQNGGSGLTAGNDLLVQVGDAVEFEGTGVVHTEIAAISGVGRFALEGPQGSKEWVVGDADLCLPERECPGVIRNLGPAGPYSLTADWISGNNPAAPAMNVPYAEGSYVGVFWDEIPIADAVEFLRG